MAKDQQSVTITLPGERPQSWNKAYAGQHWAKRKAEVERIRMAVRAAIDPDTCEVFTGPVDITVTAFFEKRPLDADNIPAKFYVDAIKGRFLADDDTRYVRSVRTVSALDPQRPRVVIEVSPEPQPTIYVEQPDGGSQRLGEVWNYEMTVTCPGGGYFMPADVAEACRHRCIDVRLTGKQAVRLMKRAVALA